MLALSKQLPVIIGCDFEWVPFEPPQAMRATSTTRRINTFMARKQTIPDDEELKLEIKRVLIDTMRNATKTVKHRHECEFHPKYKGDGKGHKHDIFIPLTDYGNVVKAASELLDRMEGKAATKKEVPKPKTSGRALNDLTDEELEAIARGETDGGAAEEAA